MYQGVSWYPVLSCRALAPRPALCIRACPGTLSCPIVSWRPARLCVSGCVLVLCPVLSYPGDPPGSVYQGVSWYPVLSCRALAPLPALCIRVCPGTLSCPVVSWRPARLCVSGCVLVPCPVLSYPGAPPGSVYQGVSWYPVLSYRILATRLALCIRVCPGTLSFPVVPWRPARLCVSGCVLVLCPVLSCPGAPPGSVYQGVS